MKKISYLFGAAIVAMAMTSCLVDMKDNPGGGGVKPEIPTVKDGDDLATALQEFSTVVNGVPTLEIPGGITLTMNEPVEFNLSYIIKSDPANPAKIVMGEEANFVTAQSFTFEGVTFDATASTKDFIQITAPAEKAKKADDSDSDYGLFYNIQLKGVTINGLGKSLIKNNDKVLFNLIDIDNCVIEIVGNNAIFALGNGYPAELSIKNSTIWSKEGHKGFLFQSHGKAVDINADYKTSWSIDNCTLYQIGVGKKVNNSNTFKGKNYLVINLSNSILDDFGSNTGNEVNGWLFGQNSTTPTITYANNTYSKAGEIVAGWTDESKGGSDQTGTAGAVVPKFADPANGDFSQTNVSAGDPRWIVK